MNIETLTALYIAADAAQKAVNVTGACTAERMAAIDALELAEDALVSGKNGLRLELGSKRACPIIRQARRAASRAN